MMALRASSDDNMEYREMMAKIAKRIDEDSLEELKYQCRDIIGPGKLEKLTSAQSLFELLEERDEVSFDEVTFLQKILKNVGRIDLCKVVQAYLDSMENYSPGTQDISVATTIPHQGNATESQMATKYILGDTSQSPKVFSQHSDKELKKIKVSQTMHHVAIEGQNCTTPFDTSGSDEYQQNAHYNEGIRGHQPSHVGGGYAIPPQVATALELVISSISRGWQSAARHLGVPDVVIDSAEDNWPRNIRNQIRETYQYWARNDNQASVEKLIQSMRRVGRNDIADDLQYG